MIDVKKKLEDNGIKFVVWDETNTEEIPKVLELTTDEPCFHIKEEHRAEVFYPEYVLYISKGDYVFQYNALPYAMSEKRLETLIKTNEIKEMLNQMLEEQ